MTFLRGKVFLAKCRPLGRGKLQTLRGSGFGAAQRGLFSVVDGLVGDGRTGSAFESSFSTVKRGDGVKNPEDCSNSTVMRPCSTVRTSRCFPYLDLHRVTFSDVPELDEQPLLTKEQRVLFFPRSWTANPKSKLRVSFLVVVDELPDGLSLSIQRLSSAPDERL